MQFGLRSNAQINASVNRSVCKFYFQTGSYSLFGDMYYLQGKNPHRQFMRHNAYTLMNPWTNKKNADGLVRVREINNYVQLASGRFRHYLC